MEFQKALEKFVDHLEAKDRSPSTVIAYKKDIEQLFDHLQEDHTKVTDVETSHIKLYVDTLIKEKTFTLKTISRKINSYKTLFRYLNAENHVESDIASPLEHPKFTIKPPRVLSIIEYKALRDTARVNVRLSAMIELLLQTGMRIGELSRAKLKDLHLDESTPYIRVEPYASNPERKVNLNQAAVDSIKQYLNSRPKPESDEEAIFITKTGNQVLVRNIRTMINNAFRKSNIDDATVNDIRNTFIVFQLENGMPLEKVADIVGHQRLTSTEKYLGLVKDKKETKASKISVL